MENNDIQKALILLGKINYKPFGVGYFVTKDGSDMGGSDYCEKCIDAAVKIAHDCNIDNRMLTLRKYEQIEKTGCVEVNGKKIKVAGRYTAKQIADSKKCELSKFPVNARFSFEGHDPDFGGGLHEPCTCENCGEAFLCDFTADLDEAKHLLGEVKMPGSLSERTKWELSIALENYSYCDEKTKAVLDQVARKIIIVKTN